MSPFRSSLAGSSRGWIGFSLPGSLSRFSPLAFMAASPDFRQFGQVRRLGELASGPPAMGALGDDAWMVWIDANSRSLVSARLTKR